MVKKSTAQQAYNKASALPADWNWRADTQPEKHDNPKAYCDLSKKMTEPSLTFVCDLLARAGYIREDEKAVTLKHLKKMKPLDQFYLNGVTVKWRIKTPDAANDKILQDRKTADDIGDYFGVKLIGTTVADVERLRQAAIDSPNMTSRKCEYTYPSQEGYRAHKSHHVISKADRQIKIEAMINLADFELMNEVTHDYIDLERNITRKIAMTPQSDKTAIEALKAARSELADRRTTLNCSAASMNPELNQLCAPDAKIPKPKSTVTSGNDCPENFARTLFNKIAPEKIPAAKDIVSANGDFVPAPLGRHLG